MNSTEIKVIEKDENNSETSLDDEKTIFQKIISNSFLVLIAKKALFYFIVFFVAISLTFLIPRLANPDVLDYIGSVGSSLSESEQQLLKDELSSYFAYGKPLWIQYGQFLYEFFFHGSLGLSSMQNTILKPVTEIVGRALPFTLMLAFPTLILSFYIGNWIGAWVGYKENGGRKVVYWIVMILQAAPFYWLAYVFLDVLVLRWGLFPWGESIPAMSWDWEVIQVIMSNFWFPFIVLVITNIGGWSSGARSLMVYEKGEGYILYSQKLGFKESKLRSYAYHNSILPQFTGINLRFNGLIGQSLVLERLFGWPGLGDMMIESSIQGDPAMIIGTFLVVILVIVIGNFIIDICYGIIDPRIRIGGGE